MKRQARLLQLWLWALLVVAVPVPYVLATTDRGPIALVSALAARLLAAGVVDGGPVTKLLSRVLAVQAILWALLALLVAWLIARAITRLAPGALSGFTRATAIAAVVLAVGLAWSSSRPRDWATTVTPGAVLSPVEIVPRQARTAADEREPCANRNSQRSPFFGDLHVHTTLSFDAASQDTRTRPADAYRFARGEPLAVQPYDAAGRPLRTLRLARPLDFAAVTDHAEFFGELDVCRTPSLAGNDSPICGIFRNWPRVSFLLFGGDYMSSSDPVRYAFCGHGGSGCLAAARDPWLETREAAEQAYDRSPACRFTTFVGYEWTLSPDSRNLHRNVIFRDARVPDLPASSVDAHTPEALWQRLRRDCTEAGTGCDALTIPHNSNLSGDLMFAETDSRGQPFGSAYARERALFEPLAEIMQHKGASECLPGAGTTDEECAFELLTYDRFGGQTRPEMRFPPKPGDFLRRALERGIALEQSLGANPFKYGFIGSTDTHVSAAGLVREEGHPGHGGAGNSGEGAGPRTTLSDDIEMNPGGLAVLWAEENTRESLWAAMKRRETYATSGPRMVVRFFGGWGYAQAMCGGNGFVPEGYASGVPMGSDLPPRPSTAAAPAFAVSALRDPGVPGAAGTPLERVQIVKGWVEGGEVREKVHDVAGGHGGASVDLATCTPKGDGSASLCAVWSDPDFDPAEPAFYYVRVLENPTCRWQVHECLALGVDCSAEVPPGLASCCDPAVPKTVQERAWTSPIWYRPQP